MSRTDQEIIRGIQQGGVQRERMVRHLLDQYSGWIKNAQQKHILTQQEVIDIYTDTILSGVDQLIVGKFSAKSKLSTWLFQIFSNKCVDKVRQKSTYKHIQQRNWTNEFPDLAEKDQEILSQLIQDEELAQISQLAHQLGEACRQLIFDTEYWGYELEEIAKKLGMKDARSASKQKYRCMKKLRHLIHKKLGIHA
ncbi:MAG: sigma-70 family RNA polymerase sigma factor [Bacteroidota bacterium]